MTNDFVNLLGLLDFISRATVMARTGVSRMHIRRPSINSGFSETAAWIAKFYMKAPISTTYRQTVFQIFTSYSLADSPNFPGSPWYQPICCSLKMSVLSARAVP